MSGGADRDRVLDATDIVRLVGEHVTLKARGREYVGLCPFHDDHKPSMYVVPNKGIYHCFSCGAGGNAFDFVMNYHKMDFLDALRLLADRAGIELTPRSPGALGAESGGGRDEVGALRAASAFAQEFFRAILRSPEHGAAARDTLRRRGVSDEMVEAFEIGAAPDRWDGLLLTVQKKGLDLGPFTRLGLFKKRENTPGVYDAFRNRLIFPIHDQIGRPVGFGGRRLNEEEEPKYLNSPESTLFDKSRTLFGLRQAFQTIQRERVVIVTEGYTDVIACHQHGVRNAVATMGTALTREHARVLQRVCDAVVLIFDGDEAGQKAADRALEVFFAAPIDVRIAVLPGGQDPDDMLKQENGAERFREAVAAATDALDFRVARLRARLVGAGLSARARLIEEELARFVELGLHELSPIRRRMVVRRIASVAGVSEQEIVASIPKRRARATPAPPESSPDTSPDTSPQAPPESFMDAASSSATSDPDSASSSDAPIGAARTLTHAEHAIGALLCEPALWADLSDEARDMLGDGAYAPGPAAGVVLAALELLQQGREPALDVVMSALDDAPARRTAASLAARIGRITDNDAERLGALLRDSVCSLLRAREVRGVGFDAVGATDCGAAQRIERLAERLAAQRRIREVYGDAPRVMPRPAGAGGGG